MDLEMLKLRIAKKLRKKLNLKNGIMIFIYLFL